MPQFNDQGLQWCSKHNDGVGGWVNPSEFPSGGGWCKPCRRAYQQGKKHTAPTDAGKRTMIRPEAPFATAYGKKHDRELRKATKGKQAQTQDEVLVHYAREAVPLVEGKCTCGNKTFGVRRAPTHCDPCRIYWSRRHNAETLAMLKSLHERRRQEGKE